MPPSFSLRAPWTRSPFHKHALRNPHSRTQTRFSSQTSDSPQSSRKSTSHAQFYSDLVPAMIPVALLGSAIYLGLRLLQLQLSHERFLDEARVKITHLETEIEHLRRQAEEAPQAPSDSFPVPPPRRSWWFK